VTRMRHLDAREVLDSLEVPRVTSEQGVVTSVVLLMWAATGLDLARRPHRRRPHDPCPIRIGPPEMGPIGSIVPCSPRPGG
jgi:hypothetical protein